MRTSTKTTGEAGDQSWTEAGEKKVIEREEQMAAIVLQRFFRAHKPKPVDINQNVNLEHDASKDMGKA